MSNRKIKIGAVCDRPFLQYKNSMKESLKRKCRYWEKKKMKETKYFCRKIK